ncbi:hypothetical protein Tco_0138861 [Tanacetum coccineum]
MEAIQAFLKEYDHIPPNEKCMALLLAEGRFLKIKQAMEEEQNQPGVMQELLLKLMDDLQILKEVNKRRRRRQLKFSRIPFGATPKVILIAWERFGKIKDALTDEQYQQEDIQELMSKLLEDVRNIREELSEYINCPSWNHPTFYDNDDDEYTIIYSKPKAITPDLPIEEPDNSLSMGDEHLDTIPSVKNLVQIPSELEDISDDTCDMPVGEDSSTFDALSDHSEILSDSNNDGTSSDDNDYEDIEYVDASPPDSELVSLEEVNDIDQEEKEFGLKDILQIQDVEPDQGGLISIVISDNSNDPLLELPEFESFHFDPSFPHTPPEPPDVEISLIIETDAPVINNFDELNEDECFDPGGGEIDVEDDDSFIFVIRTSPVSHLPCGFSFTSLHPE